jgi:hypothetical protein
MKIHQIEIFVRNTVKNIPIAILILLLQSCTYTKKDNVESYEAGYKSIQTVDRSRIYKPGTDTTDYLHFRPVDIDIWYPAKISETDSVLLFRDILGLLEKRANYYTASDAWNGITSQIAQSFCEGFQCSDSTNLLDYKTRSYKNAPAIDAKFPLVIYLCAFNGMSYENFTLFEELAKEGFVVASISSVGRFPGDMTMKKEDMSEQVYDAVASLLALKQNSNIDFSKIGIIGYSWGGLSGAFLAGILPDVSCVISLDGSEFHHYGEATEEDSDFNGIRYSPEFEKMNLSMPYLRLESSSVNEENKADSIFDFSKKLGGEKFIYKIDSALHEDFSCLSVFVRESGNCKTNDQFNKILKITRAFLKNHLKVGNSFSQTIEMELSETIGKEGIIRN